MTTEHDDNLHQARRQFLKTSGMGLGVTALASLLPQNASARTHHPPRANHVIFLFMAGAPSQIDLFDYKPELHRQFRKPLPESISQGQRVTAMTRGKEQLVAPSMFRFHFRLPGTLYCFFPILAESIRRFVDVCWMPRAA